MLHVLDDENKNCNKLICQILVFNIQLVKTKRHICKWGGLIPYVNAFDVVPNRRLIKMFNALLTTYVGRRRSAVIEVFKIINAAFDRENQQRRIQNSLTCGHIRLLRNA